VHRVHIGQLCMPQPPWGINQGVRYGDRKPSQVSDPHTTAAKRGNLLLSVPTRNTPSPNCAPSLCSLRIGQGIFQRLRFRNRLPLTTEKMPFSHSLLRLEADTISAASFSNIRRADLRQLIPPNPDMRSKLDEPFHSSCLTYWSAPSKEILGNAVRRCGQPLSAQLFWAA